jgi:hypothetical protein
LIRRIVNEAPVALDSEFTKIYADSGRPSIPPERLLRPLLLQAFYTIRSATRAWLVPMARSLFGAKTFGRQRTAPGG